MKYMYILKTGETFSPTKMKFGDFDKWVIDFLGRSNIKIKVINLLENEKLPNIYSARGFIITGSHSMVSEELPWSIKLETYIRKIVSQGIPLLGICYGHQLICKALGGISGFNKEGIEIASSKILRSKESFCDPLFKGTSIKFNVFETHYQSAIKLPPKAVVLASNYNDKHQAVRYKDYVWGVQFHPEFNINIMNEYIINQKDTLLKLEFNVNQLLDNVVNCKISNKILSNFMDIVKKRSF